MLKFLLLFLVAMTLNTFSQTQLITKKVAKVGNEVILQRDVEKYSKLYSINFDNAKEELINESLFFQGAKLYSNPPDEKDIESQIRDDKAFYANKVSKEPNSISDNEFLGALLTNNISMKTYKEYVRKKLWIQKFISEAYDREKIKGYYPSEVEINSFIADNPTFFEEKDGAILSMIYFSYYSKDGRPKSDQEKVIQRQKANECLTLIDNDDKFVELVAKYSDDLFSLNALPKGRIGTIRFDDPKSVNNLSFEIVSALKDSPKGVLKQIFETQHGLYIFKIDEKIRAKKLSKEESILKAQSYLQKNYMEDLKSKVKDSLLVELKRQIEITLY